MQHRNLLVLFLNSELFGKYEVKEAINGEKRGPLAGNLPSASSLSSGEGVCPVVMEMVQLLS